MIDTVGQLLAERRRPWRPSFAGALLAAALLHGTGLGLALAAAGAPPEAPVEYVAVQIVPLQALGRPQPAPASRPEPRTPEPRTPEPEPPSRQEPAPVLPEPGARPPADRAAAEARRPAAEPSQAPAQGAGAGAREGSPLGSAQGFAVVGANRFEGIDPDFAAYDYYLDQMLAMIHSQWVRPPTEGQVRAVLRFTVGRGGEIADAKILESSGFNSFDLAALRAVNNAGPLPPLPASYRRDVLRVTLIVR